MNDNNLVSGNNIWVKRFWIFFVLTMTVKVVLALFLDLVPDEAYYWEFARRPALSYFDHPPMVGYMIALLRPFLGDSVLAVRGFALVSNAMVTLILFFICQRVFSCAKTGFFSVLLFHLTPSGLAVGFLMTPDTPLALFWALCLITFLSIIKNPEPVLPWVFMGVFLGLGALSKYNMILMVPAVAASILIFPERRKLVFTARYWIMVLLAFAGTIPILLWNMQNEWASLKFQFEHGLQPGNYSLWRYFGEFLGGQLITMGPAVFVLLCCLSVSQVIKSFKAKNEEVFFLAVTILPALLLFAYSGSKTKVEANWPQIAYIGGFPLIAHWLVTGWTKKRALWTILPGAILTVVALLHSLTLILPVRDVSYRLHGWQEAGALIRQVDQETGGNLLFVGQGYGLAASMAFYASLAPERTAEANSGKNYRFWDSQRKINEATTIVYVDEDDRSEARRRGEEFEQTDYRRHEIYLRNKLVRTLNISIFRNRKTNTGQGN